MIDHQSNINELEFRLEHQESQHQNELSDLEARLQEEMRQLSAKVDNQVRKQIDSYAQSWNSHIFLEMQNCTLLLKLISNEVSGAN